MGTEGLESIFDDWRTAFAFVGLGLLFLFLEVFVPSGGILGVLSVGCTAFGVYELFTHDHILLGLASIVGFAGAAVLGLRFGMKRITHTGSLSGDSRGASQQATQEALVGKEGVTQTALRPAGVAFIDGRRVDVVSQGNFIDTNVRIRVVETSENRVVVRELSA